ncbi:hypothetical protein CVV26_02290 [Candidatus Kuenenbacteria bacterium HGW-Kuenenbacteria-1]|uniref:Uncharacterized protein n=1 Tax=Candidatus Kuenenbacteria bacterium HGW-Kuenenbacteria-1 TaxID=2013812 RepID=A0A2N1UNA0_9BACT|nr:MAG: hypothetical protein CVV26_02290 [Candidatus Kuenenbacteria bacterium HGW-Kuenenbacteria-1]
MNCFSINIKNTKVILALGAESDGNFSIYLNNKIYFSCSFGDLLDEEKYQNFQKFVLDFFKKNKIKPDIILTDLHPLYKTTIWGKELSQKFKAKHIQVQHHIAHIFSTIGEKIIIENCKLKIENCIGISCDGTGYGLDGKIWGGEIFKFKVKSLKLKVIERVAHLENQIMIGGDLAVKEPARMLIAILDKFSMDSISLLQAFNFQFSNKKEFIFSFVKKYYTRNQFELLYNQFKQNFNCQETSSTGRILDAVSVLLEFCKNERNYKHEPIDLLEKNSCVPCGMGSGFGACVEPCQTIQDSKFILQTTYLFEYLINNLHRDKKRLATIAQLYIAQGLYEIIKNLKPKNYNLKIIFFAGGMANNKIISSYLKSKGVYINTKIPSGDAGLSFGQIVFYLFNF